MTKWRLKRVVAIACVTVVSACQGTMLASNDEGERRLREMREQERLEKEARQRDDQKWTAEMNARFDKKREEDARSQQLPSREPGTDFETEWASMQSREAERERAQTQLDEHNARVEAAAREQLQPLADEAKRHGYRALVAAGLNAVLQEVVDSAAPMRNLRKIAIVLSPDADDFVATQVVGKGAAIFESDYSDHRVWLRGFKGAVYEGTELAALDAAAFVVVVDVKQYRTVIGGTAQAFVVEPAW